MSVEPVQERINASNPLHSTVPGDPLPSVPLDQRVTLTWENIEVWVPPPQKTLKEKLCGGHDENVPPKQILKGVTCIASPGDCVALMGASGAGKTTMLNVLTHRNIGRLDVKGEVRVNGHLVGKGISNISAYVQQDDLFVGVLTVREHLWFQAALRMDQQIPRKDKLRRVEEVIHDLGLSKCRDTKIGIPGLDKSISGGEQKRLAFAAEVLTNPPIMFCDEPTSGLDTFMAEQIVITLKRLAASGKTIVCTIHQPSSETFAHFDKVMYMAEGRLAYYGSLIGCREFFTNNGYIMPEAYNPADFYIRTLAIAPGHETECRERVSQLCDAFQETVEQRQITTDIQEAAKSVLPYTDLDRVSPYKAAIIKQFWFVLWRSLLTVFRDPRLAGVRIAQNIIIALFSGLLYFGQYTKESGYTDISVQNVNGCIFLTIMNATFSNAFGVINAFPVEFPLFKRENKNGMYRVEIYYACKMIADLPIFIVMPAVFTAIIYYMVGLNESFDNFLITVAIVVLLTNTTTSFGYFVSCMTGSVDIALVVAGPLIVPMMLFGGFFVNADSIPVYFNWFQYVSWFTYSNELLMVNQWQDQSINCTGTKACIPNGNMLIDSLGYSPDHVEFDWLMLGVLLVGFRFLGYIFIKLRSYSD